LNAHMTAQAKLMHNVSHSVGRWCPSQMSDGPELVVVVDGEAGAAFLELECEN